MLIEKSFFTHNKIDNNSIIWIVVNYFNESDSLKFIVDQFEQQGFQNKFLILVNNGTDEIQRLQHFFEDKVNMLMLDAGQNLGYFGALNFAMHAIKKHLDFLPDKIIFSNTDIEISGKDFLKRLNHYSTSNSTACIGPAIISNKLNDQNPYYINRITKTKLQRLKLVFSNHIIYTGYQFLANNKNRLRKSNNSDKLTQSVYALHGSMLIFTKVFFENCFDDMAEAPFLFGEEIFLAEICKRKNLELLYEPSFRIKHYEHDTTGNYKSKQTSNHLYESVTYLLEKYFNS